MSIYLLINAFKSLREIDFRILNAIERGMAHYEYVPVEVIARLAGLSSEKVENRIRSIYHLGVVQRHKGAYIGYVLTTRGYDCLALNALVKRGVLKSLSTKPIGVGKESDVFEGLTYSDEVVAVKFHRLGRTSFRQTRKYRTYIGDRRHISWLYQARLAAEREYEGLNILYPKGVAVPRPISWNRHVVVTSLIEGIVLYEVPSLSDPEEVLEKILRNIKKAYDIGIVHGDLSEYNIIITPEEDCYIFDWPQWVDRNHPSAPFLLKRDVENIVKFFKRKYRVKVDTSSYANILNMFSDGHG